MMWTGYTPPSREHWQGRVDGTTAEHLRWHQKMELVNLHHNSAIDLSRTIVVLGFCCDEGVRRNHGRQGARKGPDTLRKVLANLPLHFASMRIADAGNITCTEGDLAQAQARLATAVAQILQAGGFPIVLGGGHEITYGHYQGIRKFTKRPVGLINFDAHFDNRESEHLGASSGTGFWQIANKFEPDYVGFDYFAIGIQEASNTKALFDTAQRTKTRYMLAREFHRDNHQINDLIDAFIHRNEHIYITIDLDVFAASYAPGVSAPAYNGILADHLFFGTIDRILHSGKVISIDIAELNPEFDIDNRTARLAADILHHIAYTIHSMTSS